MKRLRDEGRFAGGGLPIGYKLVGDHLEEDPQEQPFVEEIRRLRTLGLSMRAIEATLSETGWKGRGGRRITVGQIQRVTSYRP